MLAGEMLIELFSNISDSRIDRHKKHKLCDILVITFCAVFAGNKSWYDIVDFAEIRKDFFKKLLELPNGIPSHDTFNRVFQLLDFDLINLAFTEWLQNFAKDVDHKIISIDGKFLNGSNKKAGNSRTSLGMVSAYSTETGICLYSVMTRLEKNKSEKQAMEQVVDAIKLKGSVVTLDAGGATPTIVSKIIKRKGDYLIGLKGNQKSLKKCCELLFEKSDLSNIESFTTEEKAHGRYDKRTYELLKIPKIVDAGITKLVDKQLKKWPKCNAFVRVTSERKNGKKKLTKNLRYYYTSMNSEVKEVGYAIRSHWKIENNLHWVLDVHFKEDHCRTRTGYADANLALIRRLVISLIKKHKPEGTKIKTAMMGCAYGEENMLKMLYSSAF